ncbi:zinc finger, CCHC-type containing protein [Tanacetum coccineum]
MRALMVQQGCDAALETLPVDMKAGEKTALMKKAYNHSGGSSRFKSRGGTGKLKCFICHSDGHIKRDCQIKKSSGFVKKGKRDQDSDSSDDEGNAYFGKAPVVVRNDEMAELLGDNRTCTIKGRGKVKIQLHDGSSFILEDVKYVLGIKRSLISLGTLEKEGYTVKMQMERIKVIKGCLVIMTGIRKKNCEYTLKAKVTNLGVQNHGGSKQVRLKQLGFKQVGFKQLGHKQLGHKQVGFKQLGPGVKTGVYGVQDVKRVWFEVELQGAQGDHEAEVFQVSNDDAAVAQRRLEDKQLEEKTNTDCLWKEESEGVCERIKVIKGCRVMMTRIRKKNCVYTLEAKVMTFSVQNHGGSKQVILKQLSYKQVGFKQLGHKQVGLKQLGLGVKTGVYGVQDVKRVWFEVELQGAQGDREAEVFQVSNVDAAVAQRRLEDKQLEEKTNTDCLVKEQEKVHLGIKVWANITVTGVLGQEGAEGNVARKKKVKEYMKANLGKLLKYNAWSIRWSPIRGSGMRKRC